ncbi:hypothetical protein GOODEAATRI_010157 [Goodea atripinnis]|uniref:Uncharacterized protein n=1 Tax=Goodea atripinnis TaxID=208336 RepID=A0ABV0PMB3_9TELE
MTYRKMLKKISIFSMVFPFCERPLFLSITTTEKVLKVSPLIVLVKHFESLLSAHLLGQICMWECGNIAWTLKHEEADVGNTEGWQSAVVDIKVLVQQHVQIQKGICYSWFILTGRQCLILAEVLILLSVALKGDKKPLHFCAF